MDFDKYFETLITASFVVFGMAFDVAAKAVDQSYDALECAVEKFMEAIGNIFKPKPKKKTCRFCGEEAFGSCHDYCLRCSLAGCEGVEDLATSHLAREENQDVVI